MIKVNKNVNLAQLDKELNGQGLIAELNQEDNSIISVGLAENNFATESELKIALENHNAIDTKELKNALLERLGITADEARLLLS